MSRNRFSFPGIILQTRPYRDADLIVVVLARELGKVSAFARSARKSKKRFSGGIDVFDCAQFDFEQASVDGRLPQLVGKSRVQNWTGLREELYRFTTASLCIELVLSFTVDDDPEGGALFNLLFHSLSFLNKSNNRVHAAAITVLFGLEVLRISGFHMLEDKIELDGDLRGWFEQLSGSSTLVIPTQHTLTERGLFAMLGYAERTLGHQLGSALPLRNMLR